MENLIGFSRPASTGTLNGVVLGLNMEMVLECNRSGWAGVKEVRVRVSLRL